MSPAVILMYHAIEAGPKPLCVEPELFREHAAAIAASGAACLTVRELGIALREGELPERAVTITFDDGCESVAANAAAVLAEHGLRATIFCVAGYLGKTNGWPRESSSRHLVRLASAAELRRLVGLGFEIGSHGFTHIALSAVTGTAVAREIGESRSSLETAVGAQVTSFAWPYGREPSHEAAERIAATYEAACSTEIARVASGSNPLSLPRVDAHYLRRPDMLRRVLEGSFDGYLRLRAAGARIRRAVWKDHP
jgi:peptidoglycan/xylan/chitin deacetylase (PgdA/CDA1 family)